MGEILRRVTQNHSSVKERFCIGGDKMTLLLMGRILRRAMQNYSSIIGVIYVGVRNILPFKGGEILHRARKIFPPYSYQIFGKSGNKFLTKKFLHQYVC